eukprot:84733-Prymnesium_polylepis.1
MSVTPSLRARSAAWQIPCQCRAVRQPRFAAAALGFKLRADVRLCERRRVGECIGGELRMTGALQALARSIAYGCACSASVAVTAAVSASRHLRPTLAAPPYSFEGT